MAVIQAIWSNPWRSAPIRGKAVPTTVWSSVAIKVTSIVPIRVKAIVRLENWRVPDSVAGCLFIATSISGDEWYFMAPSSFVQGVAYYYGVLASGQQDMSSYACQQKRIVAYSIQVYQPALRL